jgi:glycosyltransferase involved in cell wall biosynthesis
MNILFLDQFGELGGAQQCLLDLLPAFIARGDSCHVALPDGPMRKGVESLGARVHGITGGSYALGRKTGGDVVRFLLNTPSQARRIARLIDEHDIELLYVNGPRLMPAAALVSRKADVMFHAHRVVPPGIASRALLWSIRRSRASVIANCESVARSLNGTSPRLIYNGIAELPFSRREFGGTWKIGVIGRISPEKGQLEFVRAARMLASGNGWQFVICGAALYSDPAYAHAVRLASEGLPVTHIDWQDDIGAVLRDLDMLIVPSNSFEATTRVILEAFSAGVPVVAFRAGGIPEVVEDGRTGFLIEPNVEALASKLRELRQGGPAALLEIAKRARAVFEQRYTLARYRLEILDAADRARNQRRPLHTADGSARA